MEIYDPRNRLILACFEASRAWFRGERYIHKKISRDKEKLSREDFSCFLKIWQLSRSSKKNYREYFPSRLNEIFQQRPKPESFEENEFQEILECLMDDGFTNGRAASLVSKYLFCSAPEFFSPYDQYTLKALNSLGAKINIADYINFMNYFENFHSILKCILKNKNLSNDVFSYRGNTIDECLFSRRVADKYLMLIGGYGDNRMVESIKKEYERFKSKTLDDFCFVLEPMLFSTCHYSNPEE